MTSGGSLRVKESVMLKKFFYWLIGYRPVTVHVEVELPFTVHMGKHGPVYRSKDTGKFLKAADVRAYLNAL